MKKLLTDGVALGNAASRSIVWYPRTDMNLRGVRIYPDTNSAWIMAFTGRNVFFNGDDGSTDIYFSPKAPEGLENNWLETVPGKSWFVILRMYGPLKPWLDQTWRPSEVELIK